MKIAETNQKQNSLKIIINGKLVTLIFQSAPNNEAADFIKKTLINAYLIKAV